MSTPVSLKKIEEQKAKSAKKHSSPNGDAPSIISSSPLTNNGKGNFAEKKAQRVRMDFTEDVGGGKQYTSFEKQQNRPAVAKTSNGVGGGLRKPSDRAPPRPLTPQIVVDVPISVDTLDFSVDPEKIVCFSGRTHFLSNLYATPLLIDGVEYFSVEHYYQATKLYMLGGPHLTKQIAKVADPGYVKVVTRKLLRGVASNQQIDDWKRSESLGILRHAILQKFMQHSQLREKLLNTADSILAHTYDRDNFFATGCTEQAVMDWAKSNQGTIFKIPSEFSVENIAYVPLVGEGKNMLGAICMQVRNVIREMKQKKDAGELDAETLAMMNSLNFD